MEAQITGTQRKVLAHSVEPVQRSHGAAGIPLRSGKTAGVRVRRSWSAPAGLYKERFYLIDPNSREVLFEGPQREIAVWGLQSLTEIVDTVTDPFPLEPGKYAVVFALGGVMGGEFEVDAFEVDEAAA